jgi:hypothetical protein
MLQSFKTDDRALVLDLHGEIEGFVITIVVTCIADNWNKVCKLSVVTTDLCFNQFVSHIAVLILSL